MTTVARPKLSLVKVRIFQRMSQETAAFVADLLLDGRRLGEVRNDGLSPSSSNHNPELRRLSMKNKISHIPEPGKASGLSGIAFCGRWSHYGTGDHEQIRRSYMADGRGACRTCLRNFRRAVKLSTDASSVR